jgi:preprotein translocase subunit SecF
MFEIIPKTFWYDFVGKRRFWAVVSFTTSGIGLLLFFLIGPNWSIDFTGGTEVELAFPKSTEITQVRSVLSGLDIPDDAIQKVGQPNESRYVVRIQGEAKADPKQVDAVKTALTTAMGPTWIDELRLDTEVGTRATVTYKGDQVSITRIQDVLRPLPGVTATSSPEDNTFYVRLPGIAEGIEAAFQAKLPDDVPTIEHADSVGPKVGGNLRTAGIMSILVSTALHLVYVGMRFDFAFAPGAIICLLHDVAITAGILVLTRQEFGLSTVSALLTLTGYSLNDTIVVYDRIRENMHKYRRKNFGDLINDSINQTLSRTIMTSVATAMAMIPFLFIGGTVLQEFATVMLVGIVVGTYSSVYVAAPLTMILRDNQEPILRALGLSRKAAAATPGGDGGGRNVPNSP